MTPYTAVLQLVLSSGYRLYQDDQFPFLCPSTPVQKIQLKKREKVVTAILLLPKLIEKARQAFAPPSLPAVTPVIPVLSPSQSKSQLIKSLEKLEGEKVTVLPYSQIKKALETFKNFDNLLTQAKSGSTLFLTELLG